MIAVDSSVAIAAFGEWHRRNADATLVSADDRAAAVYRVVGVDVRRL